jgi:hypothetical protein
MELNMWLSSSNWCFDNVEAASAHVADNSAGIRPLFVIRPLPGSLHNKLAPSSVLRPCGAACAA